MEIKRNIGITPGQITQETKVGITSVATGLFTPEGSSPDQQKLALNRDVTWRPKKVKATN
jgi:hypothetical protein